MKAAMLQQLRRKWTIAGCVAAVLTVSIRAAEETNWGKWGKDDALGTLNYITPQAVVEAARLVRQGRAYSLAAPLGNDSLAVDPAFRVIMMQTGQGANTDPKKPLWLMDWMSLPLHGTTHWDGLASVFGGGKIYNGHDAEKNVTPQGALKNGIEALRNKVVARGVLLDIARLKGTNALASGYVITPADFEAAARKQKVEFRQGDVLLIRTGWINTFFGPRPPAANPALAQLQRREKLRGPQPGIGWAITQWLKERRIAALAVDNFHAEVVPPEPDAVRRLGFSDFDKPVNYELIRNQGMILGKLFQLDALAAACARDGVYEFMFAAAPLNIPNATGGPINPQAIK
jgi:kynurenine formamidase